MIYIRILSIITLIGSIAWFAFAPGFEPALALIGSISAIVSTFLFEGRNSKEEIMSRNNQHLEFTGCGSIGIGSSNLENILGNTYQGQFLKGFEEKEVTDRNISIGLDTRFFIKCLNNPSNIQVRSNNKKQLEESFEQHSITPEDRNKIMELFNMNKMSDTEIKDKCIEIRPYMANIFEVWTDSSMKQFSLTSVGIAIGHANVKRLVGEFANLSIWIN